ncbi:hypothetical protein EDB84DRAFT_1501303, partial [Lactarius hengduanensis]
ASSLILHFILRLVTGLIVYMYTRAGPIFLLCLALSYLSERRVFTYDIVPLQLWFITTAVIIGLGFVFKFWRRRRRTQAPSAAFVVRGASPPSSPSQMSQVYPVPSYDNTLMPPITSY